MKLGGTNIFAKRESTGAYKDIKYTKLEEYGRGRIIDFNPDKFAQKRGEEIKHLNRVKFIRAAYGRSCAVTDHGEVYVWG